MTDDAYRFRAYSGGCQCGAVRFHATELQDNPHICFCRMCQKAHGNLFADLIGVRYEHLTWTRGTPSEFHSSDQAARGFCNQCGTPLYYRGKGGEHVSLSIGAFDEPHLIPILFQAGLEGRHPDLPLLPGAESTGTSDDDMGEALTSAIRASNHQHPDHDTAEWPLRGTP